MKAIDLIRDFFENPVLVADLRSAVGGTIRRHRWADAEDLIQEAVLDMVERPEEVYANSFGELRERIRTHARNRYIDEIRHRQSVFPLAGIPLPDPREGDEDEHDERLHLLREHVRRLPENHQELLRLRYVEQLSVEEIATSLGLTLVAVHKALVRIRKRLFGELKETAPFRNFPGNCERSKL